MRLTVTVISLKYLAPPISIFVSSSNWLLVLFRRLIVIYVSWVLVKKLIRR